MQGADVLLTIAELAVAFAGFASVVVLFQHRDPRQWPTAVVVRLRTMIQASLSALFASLLPFVLHHLGLPAEALWALASLLLALAYGMFASSVWRRSRTPLASRELSRSFSGAVALVSVLVIAALLMNAADVVFPRSFGVYLVGVTWTLAFASLMFLRVVALPSDVPRSE